MANKQKGIRRNYLRLLISLFIVIIITVLGTVAINLTPKELRSLFPIVWLSSLALLILLLIFNKIALKVYTSQFRNKTAAERQDYILALRSNVGDDLFAEAKRMKRLRILLEAFITVAVCLLVLLAITSGAVTKGFTVMLFIFFVTYALDGALALIPKPITKKTFQDYTRPEDYPHIHSLARRAADTLGLKGTIRIAVVDSYEAAIARLGRTYSIILGVRLLDILSEDELYALIVRVSALYAEYYGVQPRITEAQQLRFLEICMARAGADVMITPREILRDYMTVLNILMQNEDADFERIVKKVAGEMPTATPAEQKPQAEFDPEDIIL